MADKTYSAEDIKVLRGLDPVKKRPGMYTRTTSPTHIVQEVLDNAADEALGGYASNITLTLFRDGSAEVIDDGRGIPVGISKGEKRPAVELIFTELHSGAKFEKETGDGAYKFSGGLHGVGVSVTNALSTSVEVEVKRDGQVHSITFANGKVRDKLAMTGTCAKGVSGTRVRCWPDPKYFDSAEISVAEIELLVRSKAVLCPGAKLTLRIENSAREATGTGEQFTIKQWTYAGGIAQYLEESVPERDPGDTAPPIPIIAGELFMDNGEGAQWAVSFHPGGGGRGESYVNLIPTLTGGTHESGFRNGIFEAIRSFAEHHALMPSKIKLAPEDAWSNVQYVLSAKILDPQFQGQVKEKLTNRDAHKLVSNAVAPVLEAWMNQNPEHGKRIAEMAIKAATVRTKEITRVEKKKTSGVSILPDKLTDCELAGTLEAEVFLVEGDSAGGSAKLARNKERQAILPLKGKILNTWRVRSEEVLASREVHDVFTALGIEPHGFQDTPDLSGLRYGKIFILADADVDGSHIQVLLLTMFLKHAPQVIRDGRLYIAMPPLYRIDVPSRGKSKPEQKIYIADDREKAIVIDRLVKEGVNPEKLTIQRFKGLGEMNPDQLWDTTLCPDTRRAAKVVMDEEEMQATLDMFELLMAKDESSSRRQWMELNGSYAEVDI